MMRSILFLLIIIACLPVAQAQNDTFKAQEAFQKAQTFQEQGSLAEARTEYIKAAQLDPTKMNVSYTTIGDMYMDSGSICKGTQQNEVHRKAIYIAAYNMYKKAGNLKKMRIAQRLFPSSKEIFVLDAGGTQVNLNCWINETVTIPPVGWEN